MKIIIVNYRYFISGGPERYLFNVIELLEKKGHEVIPFSVQHQLNFPCEFEKYFISPLGKGDVTYFAESSKKNIREILTFFSRMFYSFEARRKFKKLIGDTNPDIVYVLHYQNKLSPSFIDVAKKHKLPVVQRISDYGHICANQLFYNYRLKTVCELCLKGSKTNAIKYRCVYNSILYSLIKSLALKFHEILGVTKKINAFIVPSKFTISKYVTYGIPESKLIHIPSFYPSADVNEENRKLKIKYGDFALFIGRIEEEKGVMTLVKAFENTNMPLKIIGDSANGFDLKVKEYLTGKEHRIEFLGKLSFEKVKEFLSECAFTICPSECYDNFPNSVIESFAFNKPVVSTNLGSLKEMVTHNVTGLLYEPHDFTQLRSHCSFLFQNENELIRMGKEGKGIVDNLLSEDYHYDELISVFRGLVSGSGNPGVN